MPSSKFREVDDVTEVLRHGNYVKGMNFTLKLIRTVVNPVGSSDSSDKARLLVELKKPMRPAV